MSGYSRTEVVTLPEGTLTLGFRDGLLKLHFRFIDSAANPPLGYVVSDPIDGPGICTLLGVAQSALVAPALAQVTPPTLGGGIPGISK